MATPNLSFIFYKNLYAVNDESRINIFCSFCIADNNIELLSNIFTTNYDSEIKLFARITSPIDIEKLF